MRRLRFLPELSIFHKLVLTFLVVITPMYAWGLMIAESGARTVRENIARSMEAKTHFYMNQLELEFSNIIQLQRQYINDDDFDRLGNALSIMSDLDKTTAISRLQKRLMLMQNTSSYIRDSVAYIPAMNRIVSSRDYFGNLPADEYEVLRKEVDFAENPFIFWRSRLFISVVTPTGVVANEISMPDLDKALRQFTIEGQGGALLFSENHAWTVGPDLGSRLRERLDRMNDGEKVMGSLTLTTDKRPYLVSYEKSGVLGLELVTYVPEQALLGPLKNYQKLIWFMSATSVLIVLLFSYGIYRTIHSPLVNLVKGFRKLEKGDLSVQVGYRGTDEFHYLYGQFNSTVSRLKRLIEEVYEQQYRMRLAELRQLQSQINPHFLYNSFFTLYRMAKMEDTEKLAPFAKHLGDYFQYVARTADEVTLEQEWNYARAYVEIQNIRFGGHIRVDFAEYTEPYRSLSMPKLIVQPLIENCYKHGLEDQAERGVIRVGLREDGAWLRLTVEDNGSFEERAAAALQARLASTAIQDTGSGLFNVQRRLQLQYGEEAGLQFSRSDLGGLCVTVAIPWEGGALYA